MVQEKQKHEMCDRVIKARDLSGIEAKDMAKSLKIEYQAYKKYENRSAMPNHVIPDFCSITGVSIEWLLSGKGNMYDRKSDENEFIQNINSALDGFSESALKDVSEFVSHVKQIEDAKARVKKK